MAKGGEAAAAGPGLGFLRSLRPGLRCPGTVVVAKRQPPAHPRLGEAGSASSPAGRGAGGGGQQKRGSPASSRSRWGAPPGRSLPAAPRWTHAALKEEGSAVKVSAVPAPPNGQRLGTG